MIIHKWNRNIYRKKNYLYERIWCIKNVYLTESIKYEITNTIRNASQQNVPLLSYITGLKFWIGLNTKDINVITKFESSTSSVDIEVNINTNFGYKYNSRSVNIINVLYNNISTTNTTIPTITNNNTNSCSNSSGNRTTGWGGGVPQEM